MSKINGLPNDRNYLYGAEVGEPVRFDLFRRPAEDYADLAELEMVAGCIGCHDSDDQSILIIHNGESNAVDAAYIADYTIAGEPPAWMRQEHHLRTLKGQAEIDLERNARKATWLVADAPEDYDEVMNEIPRAPKLIRQVCLGIALFWIVALFLLTWAVA